MPTSASENFGEQEDPGEGVGLSLKHLSSLAKQKKKLQRMLEDRDPQMIHVFQ